RIREAAAGMGTQHLVRGGSHRQCRPREDARPLPPSPPSHGRGAREGPEGSSRGITRRRHRPRGHGSATLNSTAPVIYSAGSAATNSATLRKRSSGLEAVARRRNTVQLSGNPSGSEGPDRPAFRPTFPLPDSPSPSSPATAPSAPAPD